jgi:multidrug efflux pump subunit AcrA (membrane-fusion protein)
MKSLGKILITVAICAAVGFALWTYLPAATSASSKTRYGKVKRGDLLRRVTISGQIQPARRTIFIAPFAGYIQKIYVTVGQRVRKGDPVLSISSTLQKEEPVYPIRAPFSGTIVDVKKQEGEYVTDKDSKDIIVRMDDLSKYFVQANAPEVDASRVRKGMEVEVRVNALSGPPLKGIVRNIDLAAEEADGWKAQQSTFEVSVEIIKPPPEIRSGQTAILDIVTDRYKDVLYLEQEFINREGDQRFIIDRKGKRRNITIGHQSDLAVEITGGLSEGDEAEQIDFLKLLESGI